MWALAPEAQMGAQTWTVSAEPAAAKAGPCCARVAARMNPCPFAGRSLTLDLGATSFAPPGLDGISVVRFPMACAMG